MTINVCLTSLAVKTMSIGGMALDEDEFFDRIQSKSDGKINVMFLLGESNLNYFKKAKVIRLNKFGVFPRSISYLFCCIKNFNLLYSQDIFVAPGVTLDGFFICIFCKIFRKKSIITIHGHYKDELKLNKNLSQFSLRFKLYIAKIVLTLANNITVINEKIKQELIDDGISPEKISLRYIFADTQKFSKTTINKELFEQFLTKYKLPEKYLLYVGHLYEREMGYVDILKIMEILKLKKISEKCVILGKGPLKGHLFDLINKMNLKDAIIYIEEISHDEMPCMYYGTKILLLPIYPPAWGVGKIRLEALSMEVPVIVNYLPAGYNVIINDFDGYLILPGDIDAMAEKTEYLIRNPGLIEEFGKNGREIVKKTNDIDIYITNWVTSITSLENLPT